MLVLPRRLVRCSLQWRQSPYFNLIFRMYVLFNCIDSLLTALCLQIVSHSTHLSRFHTYGSTTPTTPPSDRMSLMSFQRCLRSNHSLLVFVLSECGVFLFYSRIGHEIGLLTIHFQWVCHCTIGSYTENSVQLRRSPHSACMFIRIL
jgi:hypothetical protein